LEDWFGKPLFERRARGVRLTDEGAALLGDVSDAFDRLATGTSRLRDAGQAKRISGTVRVNALVSFAPSCLLPRLPDFRPLTLNAMVSAVPISPFPLRSCRSQTA
jgi:DNA-binding transcriptional LysR family regulator